MEENLGDVIFHLCAEIRSAWKSMNLAKWQTKAPYAQIATRMFNLS